MFRSPSLITRLRVFGEAFSLLLDIAGGPKYSAHHIASLTQNSLESSWLAVLVNLEFVKSYKFQGSLQLLPTGEDYVTQVRMADPVSLESPEINSWSIGTHWFQLLVGIDTPMSVEVKQRWHRINMCDSGGYTNYRGDSLLTKLFHDHFEGVVEKVIEVFSSSVCIYPCDRILVYRYLARKLPYTRWADYLARNNPQHMQDPNRRKIMLDLAKELKKL